MRLANCIHLSTPANASDGGAPYGGGEGPFDYSIDSAADDGYAADDYAADGYAVGEYGIGGCSVDEDDVDDVGVTGVVAVVVDVVVVDDVVVELVRGDGAIVHSTVPGTSHRPGWNSSKQVTPNRP